MFGLSRAMAVGGGGVGVGRVAVQCNLGGLKVFRRPFSGDVNGLVEAAGKAFPIYKALPKGTRGSFLRLVAQNLAEDRPNIVKVANEESNLPLPRCEGELTRTIDQIKLFANVVEDGGWRDIRVDGEIQSSLIPIGPVGVFGASNFPLAFSTLGGDSISALAAGCTVVYKTHPGHPQTTLRCNAAIQHAIKHFNLPQGIFDITAPSPTSISLDLVNHPLIEGIGFTGSKHVGTLIAKAAANRTRPIPAYCEMGSVNPVFIFPDAVQTNTHKIAKNLAASVTLGCGQFCTNPGLVFLIGHNTTESIDHFISELVKEISVVSPGPMLTKDILKSYNAAVLELPKVKGVKTEHYHQNDLAAPAVFSVGINDFLENSLRLQEEIFGPATILVKVDKFDRALAEKIASLLEGQLTASFHGTDKDISDTPLPSVIELVSQKVGRLVWDGFPTGVAVNHSMQHGGPWPASSDGGRTTSVGSRAILRWARPLAYQNFPSKLIPLL